jgi:hypothetical protein
VGNRAIRKSSMAYRRHRWYHKKIEGQKKPFLYSIVDHDLNKKIIYPISEFFTTANDAKSIASYFADIKLEFIKKIPRCELFQFAPIIVTDFSWGLINAIMETFNNYVPELVLRNNFYQIRKRFNFKFDEKYFTIMFSSFFETYYYKSKKNKTF